MSEESTTVRDAICKEDEFGESLQEEILGKLLPLPPFVVIPNEVRNPSGAE